MIFNIFFVCFVCFGIKGVSVSECESECESEWLSLLADWGKETCRLP